MQAAPPDIADAVARELLGERVIWAASPDRWAYAKKYWANALLGIPFFAFSVFWLYGVTNIPPKVGHAVPVFFPLWGLMFVGIGLTMLVSPFFAAWTAKNAYYVVTERRAIIFEKAFKLKIRSFTPSAIANYERVSDGGPGGNIIFQRIASYGRGRRVTEIGFMGLPDFAAAERALNTLRANLVAT
jgi:hypothetical protein